jgi:tetratricopeptide (TPR) repeat protein
MLPLWLLQQILYATLQEGEGGVAFSAHIGGFAFGAAVALAMKFTQFEEKYIAPSIEKKVSLEQNPLFLKGVQLAETKDYPGALIHLQKVVREDPNHFEAFMEMRRIAELTQDRKGYNRNMAGILDLLLRNRDYDLFVDLYTQYKDHPFHDVLPARTLMAIGQFFEENNDIPAAIIHLEALVENHSADPLSMKAYSRLARLYLEKLEDRSKAIAALREAYFHAQSSEEWRSALTSEMKKYSLTMDDLGSTSLPSTPKQQTAESFSNVTTQPQKTVTKSMPEPMMIPSLAFDGTHEDWNVVSCRIEKLGLKGVILSNQSKVGQLPWKRIRAISVTNLKNGSKGNELVIDLIVQQTSDQKRIVYRIRGAEIKFERIFPRVEQSFEEAYQNLIGILIRNSGARCVPDRSRVTGPNFLVFPTITEYEVYLQQQPI